VRGSGYPVPKGTTILMNQWIVHRDRRFFEQPERFLPECWGDDLVHRLPMLTSPSVAVPGSARATISP
jgi:cytochrome P450